MSDKHSFRDLNQKYEFILGLLKKKNEENSLRMLLWNVTFERLFG